MTPRRDHPAPPPRPASTLRYEFDMRVVVIGDGLHADGNGANASVRRVRALVDADPRVESVTASHPRYLGRTEDP